MDTGIFVAIITGVFGLLAIFIKFKLDERKENMKPEARFSRNIEDRLRSALTDKKWNRRTTTALRLIARGVPHQELERYLITVGAEPGVSKNGEEFWSMPGHVRGSN